MDRFFTTPVTIIEPGTMTDPRYQNDVDDWDDPTAQTELLGWFVQLSADEVTASGRDAQVTFWRLTLPPDAPITARCRVLVDPDEYEVDQRTFKVDGMPAVGETPTGPHHVEATLKLVEG